mmetsp:Transcript_31348/g.47981  ORF Transcript_31348/g.47981 Transcript_31348/m.47981 type:complete len:125 (+) Transcript_31348:99-473(+)|eukprot:CAMPEP_0118689614 /NCGR_PEP_ID=MMETSP0800-20121206/9594_1 /TAXON_ID=210618 ORGANISM="Striatella unipunctata, Strain CCMP2910" /NCGR_SAMPLE_ID=MMETSP0800 /ASSEMBLY_ACC=CAM_ASM_000638 /LENGTH=124 /DNA_ID=CAMNT_0006587045 /DNA_START=33 /DNA_END=407 /DNA_ORIENTATION=-
MSGEIKLPAAGGVVPPGGVLAPPQEEPQSRVVEIRNMLTEEDLKDDAEYEDIATDTKEECSSFGHLKNVVIPRDGPGVTKVFLEYLTKDDAAKAIQSLQGRTFDGRKVEATYMAEEKFEREDYS